MKYGVGEKKASLPTVGKRDCEREKKQRDKSLKLRSQFKYF